MDKLIIIGAGGLGRDTETYARTDVALGREWTLKGFLDTRPDILDRYGMELKVIGDPRTYVPEPGDLFVAAIGDTKLRKTLVEPLAAKGAYFIAFRPNALIGARCRLGRSAYGFHCTLSSDVTVGDYAYIGAESLIGHDSIVCDYAHIGMRCFVGGRVKVGEGATIHPMAAIAADSQIGEWATVGVGAVVFGNVPAHTTVIGNPARQFRFKPEG